VSNKDIKMAYTSSAYDGPQSSKNM